MSPKRPYQVRVRYEGTWTSQEVRAYSTLGAAIAGVARLDSNLGMAYPISSKALTVDVDVKDEDGNITKFCIDGRIEPAYYLSLYNRRTSTHETKATKA